MLDVSDADPAAALLGMIAELRSFRPEHWDGDLLTRALAYSRLRFLAALCTENAEALEADLAASMETDDVQAGPLRLHREPTTRSAWRHKDSGRQMREDLAQAIAASLALDMATGEINPVIRNIVVATMRAAYEAIPSFSSLNKAGRERFGLRVGDYREFSTVYKVTVEEEL